MVPPAPRPSHHSSAPGAQRDDSGPDSAGSDAAIIIGGATIILSAVVILGPEFVAGVGAWLRGIGTLEAGEILLAANLLLLAALGWGIRRWRHARDAARRLRRLEKRYETLYRMSPLAFALSTPEGTVREVNRAWTEDLGYDRDDVVGEDVAGLDLWTDTRDREEVLDRLDREGFVRRFPTTLRTASGELRDVELNARRIDLNGDEHLAWAVMDRTEEREFQRQLERQALEDGLTGLPNRSLLMERLSHSMARARRHGNTLAVLFLDLDGFKSINDRHGHPAGDEVLKETARRMRSAVRGEDTVARLGGDEFVVLLEQATKADARRTANRLLSALSPPVALDGTEVTVGASVGVARWHPDSGPGFARAEDLLQAADAAMYRVKKEESGGVHVYSPESVRPAERLRRKERLEAALERDELVVYYQPVVDLRADRIAGAEALVRWRHPERGLVPPDSFVPFAEETGLIRDLDEHVVAAAVRRTAEWMADPELSVGSDFRMSVNISPHRYDEAGMSGQVLRKLDTAGLAPEALQVEITERLALRETRPFRRLREKGVSLAVDDFGTGYSSLLYLRHLDADTLKVDQYFVQEINEEQTSSIILRSVLSIGNHLDVGVVAGGVESAAQRDHLRDLGFRLAQGYFFGRPMPADEFRLVLRSEGVAESA